MVWMRSKPSGTAPVWRRTPATRAPVRLREPGEVLPDVACAEHEHPRARHRGHRAAVAPCVVALVVAITRRDAS